MGRARARGRVALDRIALDRIALNRIALGVVLLMPLAACGGAGAGARSGNSNGGARASGVTGAGGASTSGPVSAGETSAGPQPAGGDGSPEHPFLLCHANGGPERTDYPFVATFRCDDGTAPLGGDSDRGAGARLGNVGPGPDGHIVDLYEIPCARGAVRIHVDGYHCPNMSTEIDMNHLSSAQLANMAHTIRQMHGAPSDPRALELRRELLIWSLETTQVTVMLCPAVFGLLPAAETAGHPYQAELTLSYVAAIIEDGGDPAEPVSTTARALTGVAVYYDALRQADPSLHDPQLDTLLAAARAGALEQLARRAVSQCPDWSRMGVHR